jgi:hypothetical protein
LTDVHEQLTIINRVHKMLESPGINMSDLNGTFEERQSVKMPIYDVIASKRPLMFIREIIQCQLRLPPYH